DLEQHHIGLGTRAQMTDLSVPAESTRRSQSRLKDDLRQAQAKAEKLRHHHGQCQAKGIANTISMKIGADGIRVEVMLESLLRALPGETAAPVADVEPHAAFSSQLQLWNHPLLRVGKNAVAAAMKAMRQDIARSQALQDLPFVCPLADVDHQRSARHLG